MSYKAALWAFESSVPRETILAGLAEGIEVVSRDVSVGEPYIAVKEIRGVTFAGILATGRNPGTKVHRGTIHEGLTFEFGYAPAAFLGHDDMNGIDVFDYNGDPDLFMVSDGPLLGGDLAKITVDYAQRGYTNDQLRELNRMGADVTEQIPALAEHDNAIDIGLRQVFGWTGGTDYLQVCHEEQAFRYATRELVDIPRDSRELVAFWPVDFDWKRAGLEERDY
jgi:hypothetical protein